DSIVSGGCIVSGSKVKRSLLFSNCRINSYCEIRDSVLLPDVEIGRHCRVKRAIIDRGAMIENETVIGEDHDQDRRRGFRVTPSGIVLVTPDMLGQKLHVTR
ncbi:MAG: glucose-1-phosphate adenylyltransferase, partial [Alphaproteobacteria bacterium]